MQHSNKCFNFAAVFRKYTMKRQFVHITNMQLNQGIKCLEGASYVRPTEQDTYDLCGSAFPCYECLFMANSKLATA